MLKLKENTNMFLLFPSPLRVSFLLTFKKRFNDFEKMGFRLLSEYHFLLYQFLIYYVGDGKQCFRLLSEYHFLLYGGIKMKKDVNKLFPSPLRVSFPFIRTYSRNKWNIKKKFPSPLRVSFPFNLEIRNIMGRPNVSVSSQSIISF